MDRIDSDTELRALFDVSNERPVLIFKHSNACSLSAIAHEEMRRYVEKDLPVDVEFRMVVVQEARPVSNEIEERLGVRHETPQVIVVRNGRAVWNTSHSGVTRVRVAAAVEAR